MKQPGSKLLRSRGLGSCVIWILVALVLAGAAGAAVPGHGHGHGYGLVKQELRAYFQELTDDGSFSGSVLVAHDGKVLLNRGFGMADYEAEIRNRPDTVFGIASLTKAFTSMSIMILEERGLLSVDDPVADYLPYFPNGELVTVRNLLNHNSGLFEYLNNPLFWLNLERYHTPAELLEYFMYEPLQFTPGSQFEYCNSNYVTAGVIIEEVSGLTFRDFLRVNILEPLGMDRTSYDPWELDFPDRAIGYDDPFADPPVIAMYIHPTLVYTAGAVASTVEDLYRWDQALYTEALVSSESLETIFTPSLGDYGFGWFIDQLEIFDEPHQHVWHWGAIWGFHSFFSRLVDDRLTVIILSNLTPPTFTPEDLAPVAKHAAEIVLAAE